MRIQEFLKANGIEDRTPLVKVFNDILGTTRYERVIMTFLDDNGVGLKDLKIEFPLNEVNRLFFILPLLTTLFNYKINFDSNLKAL